MVEDVQRGNAARRGRTPARRPSQPSVANASTTWKSPIPVPKLGFESPDADDHAGIDRKSVAHASEQRAILLECGAAIGDTLVVDQQRAILRPGHGEFGLVPVALQHLLVRLQPGKGALQRRGRYAGAARLGAETGEETLEAIRRGNGGRGKGGGN